MDPNHSLFTYNSGSEDDSTEDYIDDARLSGSQPYPEFLTFGASMSPPKPTSPISAQPINAAVSPRPTLLPVVSLPPGLTRPPPHAQNVEHSPNVKQNHHQDERKADVPTSSNDLTLMVSPREASRPVYPQGASRAQPRSIQRSNTSNAPQITQDPPMIEAKPVLSRSNTAGSPSVSQEDKQIAALVAKVEAAVPKSKLGGSLRFKGSSQPHFVELPSSPRAVTLSSRPVPPPKPSSSPNHTQNKPSTNQLSVSASTSPKTRAAAFPPLNLPPDVANMTYEIESDEDNIYESEDSYESDGDEDTLVYSWIDEKKNEEDRQFWQKKQEEVLIATRTDVSRIGSVFQQWIRQNKLPPENPFRKIYDELSLILTSAEKQSFRIEETALTVQVKLMKQIISETFKRLEAVGLKNRFAIPNLDKLDFLVQSFKLLSSVNAKFHNNDGSSIKSAVQNFTSHLKELFLWYVSASAALKS